MNGHPVVVKRFVCRTWLLPGWACLAFGLLALATPRLEAANPQPSPLVSAADKNGKITAVFQNKFQIDGRTYSFAPDAIILDDEGNPFDAQQLFVGADVKYHVNKEQQDKVDQMIVFLPR